MSQKENITFITMDSSHPDWVLVHPCQFTTFTGTLGFPGGLVAMVR